MSEPYKAHTPESGIHTIKTPTGIILLSVREMADALNRLWNQRKSLRDELDQVRLERNRVWERMQEARQGRDEVFAELEKLKAEKDELGNDLDEAYLDRDNAREERDVWRDEAQRLESKMSDAMRQLKAISLCASTKPEPSGM